MAMAMAMGIQPTNTKPKEKGVNPPNPTTTEIDTLSKT
jgi:hypothetical protein